MKHRENEVENNVYFWQKLDTLWLSSQFILEKAKGESHKQYRNLVYPVDYGYLSDTCGTDESPIHVYKGSKRSQNIDAILVTADILQKDCIVKLLIGCTEEEMEIVLKFVNSREFQKAILVRRTSDNSNWMEQE